jgi:hypothetical protein
VAFILVVVVDRVLKLVVLMLCCPRRGDCIDNEDRRVYDPTWSSDVTEHVLCCEFVWTRAAVICMLVFCA